jgi:hypothetical protein
MAGLSRLGCWKWLAQRAQSGKGLGILLLAATLLVGCGAEELSSDADSRTTEQDLSIAQSRVLGFEAPTQDWSSDNGSVITSSSTVTQGAASLSFGPKGNTQLSSVAIRAPGQARTAATVDVRLSKTVTWGEIRLVLKAPSQGQAWLDVGGQSLVGKAANTFHTLSFTLSSQARTVLNSSASDLRLVVVYNGPNALTINLDKLLVSNDTTVTPPGPGTPEEFSVAIPSGSPIGNVFLSGTDKLTIDDRVTLGVTGKLPTAYSGGTAQSKFAGVVQAHVNVLAKGNDLYLASQSRTYGSIQTAGTVTRQDATVKVDGGVTTGAAISAPPVKWTVKWPGGGEGDIAHPVDAPNKVLAPGRYAKVTVGSRASMTFASGDYYLDELRAEPQAKIYIDASSGPVRIYTRTTLYLNVGVIYTGGVKGDLFLGHLGTSSAYFEEAIVATVVAPKTSIELRRPASGKPHEGTFFGKSVHVLSDATVLHIPNNFTFLCPTGDFDGDGVLDCFDPCWNNPDKIDPGVCLCNKPDTDTDGDGIPNCEDGSPEDPVSVFTGDCFDRDPGSGAQIPVAAGKRCDDGICSGVQTCDGAGHCGDPNSCKPHASCHFIYANSTDKWYWICDAQVNRQTAASICDSVPGSKLARIPSSGIGQLIKKNATTDVWIGVNANDHAGEWRWRTYTSDAGTLIWKGGQTGRPVYGRHTAWASPPADSARCAYLNRSGVWVATGCGEQHGFVCEVSNDRLGGGGDGSGGGSGSGIGTGEGIDHAGEIVGIPPYQGPSDECISQDEAVGGHTTEAQIVSKMNACQDCLTAQALDPTVDCSSACDGPMSVPASTERCTDDAPDEWLMADASCNPKVLALALDGGGNSIDCTSSPDCTPVPPVGTACAADSDCTGANERCNERICVVDLLCDISRGKCVVPDPSCGGDNSFTPQCEDVDICEPAISQDSTDKLVDDRLAETPATPDEFFGTEAAEPPDPATFPADPCAADGTCGSIKDSSHPWCKVDMVSDNDPIPPGGEGDNNTGGGNDSSDIKFYFDPVFGFTQSATIGTLGIPDLDVHAEAGVGAGVKLGFAGNPDFKLIDAWAGLDADECGMSSDVHLLLFGQDLIADARPDFPLPLNLPSADARAECQELLQKIREAADRLKKALHDSSELLRQYKALRLNGKTFPPDLCRAIAADGNVPRGFPSGNCPATGTTETPEQTLQRFIDYYVSTIQGFGDKKYSELAFSLKDYVAEFAEKVGRELPNPGAEFTLYSYGDKKTTTIFSTQFFIGPIPAFLELGATMDFGIDLNARVGLRLGDLAVQVLDIYSTEPKSTEVAYAGLAGNPYAGAGIYLFAGVGFGIPGFKVQLGIQGDIHIGTVYVPAYAGAGLYIGTRPDGRGVPDTFAEFAQEGAYLIPPRIYSVQAGYTAGLEARLRDLVSGSIAAKLKLKVLFFSKTWRRTLFEFPGFCPQSKNAADGSQAGCDFPIFRAEGELIAAEGEFGLGQIKMPLTFPQLSLSRVVSDIEAQLSMGPPMPPADEETFDQDARVGQLFFDTECAVCKPPGFASRPEDRCVAKSECCGDTSICYKNTNVDNPNYNTKGCRECLAIDDSPVVADNDDICHSNEDCCQVSETVGGKCGKYGRCTTGACDAPCYNNVGCQDGYVCDKRATAPAPDTCQKVNASGNPDYDLCHPPPPGPF